MIVAMKRRGSRGRTLTVTVPAALSIVVVMLAVFTTAYGPSTWGESPAAAEVSLGIGGTHRTEATGLGSAAMFSGVLLIPSAAASLISASGSYVIAFTILGVMAAAAGGLLALKAPARERH